MKEQIKEKELLNLIKWLINPEQASKRARIEIIKKDTNELFVAFGGKNYRVYINNKKFDKLIVSRENWAKSLYLNLAGMPFINF